MCKTSARGNFRPRSRVSCVCPICNKRFTLLPSTYQKYERKGTKPTDSRACGQKVRFMNGGENRAGLSLQECQDRRKEYMRKYRERPEIKERQREYKKKYNQKPEVKERMRESKKVYMREYRKKRLLKK